MNEPNQNAASSAASPGNAIKGTKHRSPNYPVFDLQTAIELAKQFHEKYKRSIVPINLAQLVWGYKENSAAGNQAVAAMKSYNLIEVDGQATERKIRPTELAYRIVGGHPNGSEDLKRAAIAPPIHNELWEKYKSEEYFPDDDLIRNYLRWERPEGKFNEDTVDNFISNFRSSLNYARLLPNQKTIDKIVGNAQAELRDVQVELGSTDTINLAGCIPMGPLMTNPTTTPPRQNTQIPPTSTGTRDIPISLPSLEIAVVRAPIAMSEEDYEFLMSTLKVMKKKLVQAPNQN